MILIQCEDSANWDAVKVYVIVFAPGFDKSNFLSHLHYSQCRIVLVKIKITLKKAKR